MQYGNKTQMLNLRIEKSFIKETLTIIVIQKKLNGSKPITSTNIFR